MVPDSYSRHQHLHGLPLPDSSSTPSCLDHTQAMTSVPTSNPVHPGLGSASITHSSDALPQHSPKQVKAQQRVEPPAEHQMELHITPCDYFDLRINGAEPHSSSSRQTETPSGYYTHTFQGKPVTVITDASYISHAVDGDTMFGLTRNALAWLERMQEIPPDPTRRPTYPPFSQLQPHQRMTSLAEAQQYQKARKQAQRVAPFADPTLAQVRANAPQLVEDWYTAAIDLSQTRDNGHSLGCCYLTRRASNGQPYTTSKAIMMLFWKMLDMIIDGVTNGHLKTTNGNQIARMRRQSFSSGLYAQQIVDDAIQSIRKEKMILVDLLGPAGQECMENFIWSPKGYADVKLYDRNANMMRKFGGKKAMEERATTTAVSHPTNTGLPAPPETPSTVQDPPSVSRDSRTPDQGLPSAEASGASPSQQPSASPNPNPTLTKTTPPDLFPPWSSLPTPSRLITPAAASAHHRAASQPPPPPATHPDPNLAAFRAHLPLFAAHLYTAVVSVSHVQDNPSSPAYARFVRPPYAFAAATPDPRVIMANCLLFCHALASRPAARPPGAAPQLARHRRAFLAKVLHGGDKKQRGDGKKHRGDKKERSSDEQERGKQHHPATPDVLQRFGAACEVVRREKTVADAFRGREGGAGLAELAWEPFAFGRTKGAHRRSNRTRPGAEREGGAVRRGQVRVNAAVEAAEGRGGGGGGDGGGSGGLLWARDGGQRADGSGGGDQGAVGDGGGNDVLVWAQDGGQRTEGFVGGVPQRSVGEKRAWDEDAVPAFSVKRQRLSATGGSQNVIDLRPMHSRRQRRDNGQYIKLDDPEPCNPFAHPPVQPQVAGLADESSGFQPFQDHGLPLVMLLIGIASCGNNGGVNTEQQLKAEQDVSTLMGDVLAESPD